MTIALIDETDPVEAYRTTINSLIHQGDWQPIVPGGDVISPATNGAARLNPGGDVVRLKGLLQCEFTTGHIKGTLPIAMSTTGTLWFPCTAYPESPDAVPTTNNVRGDLRITGRALEFFPGVVAGMRINLSNISYAIES
jgi:hypothetical protein